MSGAMKITTRKILLEASPYLFILPFVIFCLVLLFYPVVYSLANFGKPPLSVRQWTNAVQWPHAVSGGLADDFLEALINTSFAFWHSFQFAIGFLLALLFQANFPQELLPGFTADPLGLAPLTAANIFKGLFNESVQLIACSSHWDGSLSWLSIRPRCHDCGNIWIGFPFNFILLYAGMRSIPEDVYEAAKIDGATFWKRVGYITLPLLKPVSFAVLMLGTIYTVKVFDLVWIMTAGGPANGTHLLSTYAYQVGFSLLNFGQAAAIATLMVLLVLFLNLVQLLLQRK
jgi:multiple sugar transport system permease protein